MSTIKQLLAITGTVLIIASCQEANSESEIAALQQATVDTVPKGRADTIPKRTDTMRQRTDTMGMHHTDTMGMHRSDTMVTGNTYIDLSTGQPVELYYDPKTRRTYSSTTNQPVDWYVNTATGDTVYGRGRYVVNNYIIRGADNTYRLDAGKIKIDKDDIKIKDGNKKFKMDKSEMKMKGGDMKGKVDTTGMKMKSGDMKKKTGEGESKTKY